MLVIVFSGLDKRIKRAYTIDIRFLSANIAKGNNLTRCLMIATVLR